jgi:NAD(P)-dependent dehydrogenase (short-subunit alcohol dehydrogenase family)
MLQWRMGLGTGASQGLGRLTARALACAGHRAFAALRDPAGPVEPDPRAARASAASDAASDQGRLALAPRFVG